MVVKWWASVGKTSKSESLVMLALAESPFLIHCGTRSRRARENPFLSSRLEASSSSYPDRADLVSFLSKLLGKRLEKRGQALAFPITRIEGNVGKRMDRKEGEGAGERRRGGEGERDRDGEVGGGGGGGE